MPLYEYTCQICGNAFEKLRPVSGRDGATPCPDCGGDSQRQLSLFISFSSASDGETSAIAGGGGCCGSSGSAGCACSMTG